MAATSAPFPESELHRSNLGLEGKEEGADLFLALPPDYNEDLYRSHKDLEKLTPDQLLNHWQKHGREEGRRASIVRDRQSLLGMLADLPIQSALEIGCFDQPSLGHLKDRNIMTHYADYLSEVELKTRAALLPGRDPETVPPIEYVLSNGYDQIKHKYDIVVSHHCIEHQPDLLSHFLSVAKILRPQGLYLASIPDKRKCFDYFIPTSSLIDVLAAFYEKRSKPSFKSVLEHRCFIVEDYANAVNPIWNPEAGRASRQGFDRAFQEYCSSPYVDVHTFQFTSFTLQNIIQQLVRYSFLPQTSRVMMYNGVNEFYMALQF
jgi:SAM-dependent methyltransferase